MALAPALRAEHGGLGAFNRLTGKWYQVSQTAVPNTAIEPRWAEDDSILFFEEDTADGKQLRRVDPASGDSEVVELAEDELPPRAERGRRDRGPEGRQRRDRGRRGGWQSPDGRWEVVLRRGSLVLRELGEDGGDGARERVLMERDGRQLFRDRPVWAPDSSRFAIWRTRDVEEQRIHYVDSAPDDRLQPKHFTHPYPKPGDEIDTREPWVFFVDGSEPLEPDRSQLENPFECRALAWREDSRRATFEFIERGFGRHHVIEIDSGKRRQRVLVREDSDTFISVYNDSFRHDLDDGREILWVSERDGWKHLYLLDGRDGSVIRQLTRGEWVVRDVADVDEDAREVLVRISGCFEGQDPYLVHYIRVSIDDGTITPLTRSDGTHDRLVRSPGGKYYTCRWSRVDHPPVTELRRWGDGSLVTVLAEADDTALREAGWSDPEPFVAKDRDGRFDIHGIIIRPPDFDPARRYPVIEQIYAGPHDSHVPKSWRAWYAPAHEVAVHGFIVVRIDGKGTANRCREFHHFCYKNLKDAGFPDRIAWMKAAAARVPQMDLARVGIFGGSAGGQNALGALLFHPGFYKAAAADCGCHDNRMDKIWWNEQWMDWPIGPHYEENSNTTHIDKLEGALLLSVGELDKNVDPSSTYQVVNELIKADKDFEFLLMTGAGHGSGEKRYAQRRRVDFFQRHLGGPES